MKRCRFPLFFSILVLWPSLIFAQESSETWPDRFGGEDPAPQGLSDNERAILDLLRSSLSKEGQQPCRESARLTQAARAHAKQLLSAQASPGKISTNLVRNEVLRAGGFDPVVLPWAFAYKGQPDMVVMRKRISARFEDRSPTHCGVGIASGKNRNIVVLIGVRRHASLQPFPSKLARGDRVRLQGRIDTGYRAPTVMLMTPLGEISEHQTLRRAGNFGAWLNFTTPGRYTIEVMATGSQGPEVVVLFPVFVDTPPEESTSTVQSSQSEVQDESPERISLRLLNEERQRADLLPLEIDEQLSQLASNHCLDMYRRGYFGHVSPSGLDLTARLENQGIEALHSAENLVRSSSPQRAHAQLMESPAHRANILDPDLTHIGIGTAEREGQMLITQIFVTW